MTVREAFEKAFGPLPEGAVGCHLGHWGGPGLGFRMEPTIYTPCGWPQRLNNEWDNGETYEFPLGPDISNEDAYPFREFFGAKYKSIVEAEKSE